jgi:hypothetical protein
MNGFEISFINMLAIVIGVVLAAVAAAKTVSNGNGLLDGFLAGIATFGVVFFGLPALF